MNDNDQQNQPTEGAADAEPERVDTNADQRQNNEGSANAELPASNPNHEAARWRTRLRDVEAERDQFAAQVANLQRAQVDAHITALGVRPAAVWAAGATLDDLVSSDGTIDEQKIKTAVDSARRELGIETPKRPVPSLKSGSGVPQERRDDWRSAFSPRRER